MNPSSSPAPGKAPSEPEHHPVTVWSWVTVGLLTASAIVLGFTFVTRSIPLLVVGLTLGLLGLGLGIKIRIMDSVEY